MRAIRIIGGVLFGAVSSLLGTLAYLEAGGREGWGEFRADRLWQGDGGYGWVWTLGAPMFLVLSLVSLMQSKQPPAADARVSRVLGAAIVLAAVVAGVVLLVKVGDINGLPNPAWSVLPPAALLVGSIVASRRR